MKAHEYQARQLLQKAGAPVPEFEVIDSPDQVAGAIEKLGGGQLAVKAQVHAGGRGKAGYVILSDDPAQIEQNCRRMFAEPMVSRQTGPEGVKVKKILLAAAVDIDIFGLVATGVLATGFLPMGVQIIKKSSFITSAEQPARVQVTDQPATLAVPEM